MTELLFLKEINDSSRDVPLCNNATFLCTFFFSHVINVKDAKDFLKNQDPVHGVMKGENRKSKAGGYLAELITCLPLFE